MRKSYLTFSKVGPLQKGGSGDTIIEVMLAIVLISAAIALAVGMSHRNLNTGLDSAQRSQALSVSQGQVEHIRNAYLSGSSRLNSYKISQPFCILNNSSVELTSAQNSRCTNFNSSPYSVAITYASNRFTVTTSWSSNTSSTRQDQQQLFYKLPG